MQHVPVEALDRTGAIASIACAFHCLCAPLVLLVAPALGGLWVHPGTHLAIAALVLPVAAFALRAGLRAHGRRWIAATGFGGMALVALGTGLPFVELATPAAEHACETCHDCCPTLVVDPGSGESSLRVPAASILTMAGGALLIAAHLGNLHCGAGCSR